MLAVFMVFSSCGYGNDSIDAVSESQAELTGIANLSSYVIIGPEKATKYLNSKIFALRDGIEEKTGVRLECRDDFVKTGVVEPADFEIVIGESNRGISKSVANLGNFEYVITAENGKIAIKGGSDYATGYGIDRFISDFIRDGKVYATDEMFLKGSFSMNDFSSSLNPVLEFDFDGFANGDLSSSDGRYPATVTNVDYEGGYSEGAVRTHGNTKIKGGVNIGKGKVAEALAGADSYSVSMWIMPYQSYHGSWLYRLLTLYGEKNNGMLYVYYSSPLIKIVAGTPDGSGDITLQFPYSLETAIPAFDAVNTNDGVWQHIVVTVDFADSSVKLYVNGNEIKPTDKPKITFNGAKFSGKTSNLMEDCIGGDSRQVDRSFNGVIDEFCVFNTALTAEEASVLYMSYGKSDTPSVTDDQKTLKAISEKLGSGLAVLGNSANAVMGGRVVKADINDYSVTNEIIDGKICVAADLASRFSGREIGISPVHSSGKDYYPASELAKYLGMKYLDFTSDNGMFVFLADDSTLTDQDISSVGRLIPFCTVGEHEPRVNVEQTRTVIATSDTAAGDYTYSPSIVRCGDHLYATRDISCKWTDVFASGDNGATWEQRGRIHRMWWATIFEHDGDIFVIGRYDDVGGESFIGITKSTDGGFTWTDIDSERGGISYNGYGVHCGPTPVVEANGKIYRVFESTTGEKREFVAMCDADSDLLDPKNWSFSKPFVSGFFPNEGNAIIAPDGNVFVLSRVSTESAYLLRLLGNGELTGIQYVSFPSTANKFTCRYDDKSGKYLAIVCPLVDPDGSYQRNWSALAVSDDLVNWKIAEMLLCDRELVNPYVSISQHAFQYVDWIFDGDDILFVVRESAGDCKNFHDSNYLTMYRIVNYAEMIK